MNPTGKKIEKDEDNIDILMEQNLDAESDKLYEEGVKMALMKQNEERDRRKYGLQTN